MNRRETIRKAKIRTNEAHRSPDFPTGPSTIVRPTCQGVTTRFETRHRLWENLSAAALAKISAIPLRYCYYCSRYREAARSLPNYQAST